ncbi:MAG: hypothetical protein KGD59_11990 [Candidatus Heimdallarchaeota archaeon]|nr:hypothetical protein [Candidatus Heimdallarchaeota archaeon]MBY8995264.1 hypothetical protein [Candidatus Heimdallarchaeota archaeon]
MKFDRREFVKISFLLIIILTLFTAVFINVNQAALHLSESQNQYNQLSVINQEEEITKLSSMIAPQSNWVASETVWSQPEQLTHPDIKRSEYTAVQGPNNTYYCFWIKELRIFTNAIYFSQLENFTTNKWSIPKQVIQLDSTISDLTAVFDVNSSLHLAFISTREEIWQINYFSKETQNFNWSSREVFARTSDDFYSSLVLSISNEAAVHLAWISTVKGTSDVTLDSSIQIITKNLTTDSWGNQRELFNAENPLAFDMAVNQNNTVQIGIIKWDISFIGNEIVTASSDNDTLNWSPTTQIANYVSRYGSIQIYPSIITGGFHVLWNYEFSHKKAFHRELHFNGTIRTIAVQINLLSTDGYIAGIGENQTTGDLYVLYAESFLGNTKIMQRKRNGGGLTWEIAEQITTDSQSFDPIYMQNYYSNTSEAVLVNLNKEKMEARVFTKPTVFSDASNIIVTSFDNNKGKIIIDSDGTKHFVWQYIGPAQPNIYYQKKEINGSWEFKGSIMTEWKAAAQNPRITIDSNDNLHCLFVADSNISSIDGLFYVTKNYNQDNWSIPELVKTPQNNAEDDNVDLVVDPLDTIHIVWSEYTAIYQNKLIYSYKQSFESVFTSEDIILNSGPTTSNFPDFVIDSFGTIHLTYTEENYGSALNEVDYRYKLVGQSWSTEEVIIASIDVDYNRPLLTVDSKDTLRLVYLQRYSIGIFLVSSGEMWQKPLLSGWSFNSTLFSDELAIYHAFLISKNDILIYSHHVTNLPNDKFPNNFVDKIFVSFTNEIGEWGARETMFLNPMDNDEIIGIYDEISDNSYFIINDERRNNPQIHLIYRQNDTDQDSLGDIDEDIFWTDKYKQDSDNDLLVDGYEVRETLSNPAIADTDWDTLGDGVEVNLYLTNPLVIDSDGDGITDGDEVKVWGTSPIDVDSDGDSISDFDELFVYLTNPNNIDTDFDDMPDFWEIVNNLDPNFDDALNDEDSDDLFNVEEYFENTDPYNNDTDTDELSDGDEVKVWFTSPLKFDTDDDTIGDSDEVLVYHTNPLLADSDGDGFSDREEINSQTDPNDPKDNIRTRKVRTALVATLVPTFVILTLFAVFETRYRRRTKNLHEIEKDEIALEEEKLAKLMDSRNNQKEN